MVFHHPLVELDSFNEPDWKFKHYGLFVEICPPLDCEHLLCETTWEELPINVIQAASRAMHIIKDFSLRGGKPFFSFGSKKQGAFFVFKLDNNGTTIIVSEFDIREGNK